MDLDHTFFRQTLICSIILRMVLRGEVYVFLFCYLNKLGLKGFDHVRTLPKSQTKADGHYRAILYPTGFRPKNRDKHTHQA